MKYYKEFLITLEPFNPELIEGILWELNISGINEEVNCLKVFADEDSGVDREDIISLLEKIKDEKMLREYSVEVYLNEIKNWNEEWEKNLNIIEVSDRIIIKPTFREYKAEEGQIVITVNPKMSFGTGEHPTTKLCLRLVEKYASPGIKALDVGSGTGVLAIAALKLGAEKAVAVDNDEWCYENGMENAKLNKAEDKINFKLGVLQDVQEKDFNLITANIQKNILNQIAEELASRIAGSGILILSGLLYSDEKEMIERYTSLNLLHLETKKMEEWIAMAFKK